MNLVGRVESVASKRSIVAWWRRVDQILHKGCICHGECTEEEAPRNASNRSERNTNLTETRVEKAIEDRDQKNDGKSANVLHDVVGNSMELHGASWYHVNNVLCFIDGF